jgi:hypothetical protein
MKHRYIVMLNPFFGMVPIFYSRSKAVAYCAGTRQHLMNIYPRYLNYKKSGNIYKSPRHSIITPRGEIVYSAEICQQEFDQTCQAWVNTAIDS